MGRRWAGRAAGALALLAATGVVAAPVRLQWSTYLRAGPGPGFAAVDELEHEAMVDLGGCRAGWCRVTAAGAAGFIDQAALTLPRPPRFQPGASPVRCVTAAQPGGRRPEPHRFCRRR